MVDLNLGKLDDNTFALLQGRASRNGVSVEEEARQIVQRALRTPMRLGDLALQLFGERGGVELTLPKRTIEPPLDLGT